MFAGNSPVKRELREPLLPDGDNWQVDGGAKRRLFHAKPPHVGGTSVLESVCNVLNVYVGLGLLSKPYAIAMGGWLSVGALAVLCAVANVTGKLIVRCFAKLPREKQTYAELGRLAFGEAGFWVVHVVVMLELCGALMVLLIFVWKNALLLAPWYLPDAIISEQTVAIVLTALATPTVLVLDFGSMALIGTLGVVASVIIVSVVVGVAGCYGAQLALVAAPPPPLELPLLGAGFPVSIGIFVLSLGGHAALPGVYAAMAEPKKFDRMLDISLVSMFAIYATVGLAGYLAFGWLHEEKIDILSAHTAPSPTPHPHPHPHPHQGRPSSTGHHRSACPAPVRLDIARPNRS
jgi:vesicular inhibitory amino acid transporter